jgi:uncharacterized membrane protein (DUF373 family)
LFGDKKMQNLNDESRIKPPVTIGRFDDKLMSKLLKVIRFSVRILAIIMTFVILWGVLDVAWVIYQRLIEPPFMLLTISDILATFGAFIAVMIAIEIFENITVYLRDDVFHVEIVMATALMAIARKVIVLDYKDVSSEYVWATAGVVLAMSIGYWLVIRKRKKPKPIKPD